MRIAAVADVHFTRTPSKEQREMLVLAGTQADVFVLCGDLTDYGLPEEAHALAAELRSVVTIPVLAVLGNHDYESGQASQVQGILADAGVHVLDGDIFEHEGVGFAGVRGFAGGFGRATLSAWGEPIVKEFVQEAVNEALKLDAALARLRTPRKVALLHYAPIRATVEGEFHEIYPFLGCSRLEEPLDRYHVDLVLHGHAHGGSPEGRTHRGAPVFNVALPVIKRADPNGPPFRVIEL